MALIIGTAELLSILAEQLQLSGGFWDWVSNLDLNTLGFVIVGLFAAVWAVALIVWKVGRVEERWQTRLDQAAAQRSAVVAD